MAWALINGAVDVPPVPGNLHVGLVDKPTTAVRESVLEVPTDGEHDDLWREPLARESGMIRRR